MKKNYFLVVLLSFAMVSMNAQFDDDMESYALGQPIFEGHWTDWGCGGGAGCAIMSDNTHAQGGAQSGLIPDDGSTDAVLDLGNKILSLWGLEFWMYVPSNQEAYWNLQGEVPIGAGEWIVGNIFFNQDNANPGVGLIDNSALGAVNFNFPHDQWFRVIMNVNIEDGISLATWGFSVDEVDVIPSGTAFTDGSATVPTSLGGIDFFSISANNLYWLDSFTYVEDEIFATQDFSTFGFRSALRNDILTLKANEEISNVSIYNMLGQEVYRSSTNTSEINMSSFANGTYIVKVNIAGTEGTVKIVK